MLVILPIIDLKYVAYIKIQSYSSHIMDEYG